MGWIILVSKSNLLDIKFAIFSARYAPKYISCFWSATAAAAATVCSLATAGQE